MIREPVERIRREILLAVVVMHVVAAYSLLPMHYAAEDWYLSVYTGDDFDLEHVRVLMDVVICGVTHGVALGQLTIVALGAAFLRWHWAIRLIFTVACWVSLLICWTFASLYHHTALHIRRDSYSDLTGYGWPAAEIVSLVFLLFVVGTTWLAGCDHRVSFTFANSSKPMDSGKWQMKVIDVLLITTFSAAALNVGLWAVNWWNDAVDKLVNAVMANTIIVVHAIVATPLILAAAWRVANKERTHSWRTYAIWFLIVCVVELLVMALRFGVGGRHESFILPLFFPCLLGSQLLVVVATIRALVVAGGRLVRAGA